MSIYTDLACEARELAPDVPGVTEERESYGDIAVTRIRIEDESAAKKLDKLRGSYITVNAPGLTERSPELFLSVAKRLSKELKSLLSGLGQEASIMVVGLGNRSVTPDSLGPRVAERIFVTRHIKRFLPDAFDYPICSVASVAPGVLGSTGIETLETVKGLTERVRPQTIIAVDSLASRRASRISATVQLSDAGISPGSGVGNLRAGLNIESLGVPVIAIGVPLVVHASTITREVIQHMAEQSGVPAEGETLSRIADSIADERMDDMIVTPKDIDCIVEDMSGIVANAVNMALFGEKYEEVRMLVS